MDGDSWSERGEDLGLVSALTLPAVCLVSCARVERALVWIFVVAYNLMECFNAFGI
jgi:hypothetical protein